jgi:hypothetical protein
MTMTSSRRLAPLFFLQIIPLVLYPPDLMASGFAVLAVVALAYAALGFMVLRGRAWALSLSIFSQGFNVIIRTMMFFSQAVHLVGDQRVVDVAWIVTGLVAIALSVWFLFRLDRADVRLLMTA